MARKFLSFLGTTDYKECTYAYGNLQELQYSTRYIQEAILKTICKDWTKEDTAVIFLTKEAEKKNWYNQDDENRRLKTNLENLHINVKGVSIPEGRTEDEIWQILHIVTNEIDDNDEIIFDITHSFRS
ncbi:MAG: CRISPR-associated DxTHG motif protein, partial [Tissierellales bacterium]